MYYPTRGPEARLYCACVAAFFLPIAMFIYAWCSFSHVHWIGLVVGITVRTSGHLFFRNIYTYSFSVIRGCYVCCVPCSFLISRRLVTYSFGPSKKKLRTHILLFKVMDPMHHPLLQVKVLLVRIYHSQHTPDTNVTFFSNKKKQVT